MNRSLKSLIKFIKDKDGINDKTKLSKLVADKFELVKDRSVYYCRDFAIRFSSSKNQNFSNTVLSLSRLQKYDNRPFIACLVTPSTNHLYLANTTFLKKISHTSQELRENNIRGSFNGSDITREFEGITNSPENFERLFHIHEGIGFDGNLPRLVEVTNSITPLGRKFIINGKSKNIILDAPNRAKNFVSSKEAKVLKKELDEKVRKFKKEILKAEHIKNGNVRGRIIEYLITGKDDRPKRELISALRDGNKEIPQFKTANELGDYRKVFDNYDIETDVKTKIMILDSNPKAYNLDKMLEFLSSARSVFMFYFVGVDPDRIVNTVLVSMFQGKLLCSTKLRKHWSGRNSRGATQFEGKTIGQLIMNPEYGINKKESVEFLKQIIAL
ncbi:MAG: hypothetical protein JW749_11020 [Sedimentisphaerales bacterium]|nr:hypothetical protein [Sedimentisphaerales bacterium]